jgi:hypothetical protein
MARRASERRNCIRPGEKSMTMKNRETQQIMNGAMVTIEATCMNIPARQRRQTAPFRFRVLVELPHQQVQQWRGAKSATGRPAAAGRPAGRGSFAAGRVWQCHLACRLQSELLFAQ